MLFSDKTSLVLVVLLSSILIGCSSKPATNKAVVSLPVVQIRLDSNRYILPECPRPMEIPRRLLLELPTVQEAELSGYMPAASCSDDVIKKRIALEIELYGNIQPTEATEKRRSETLFRDSLNH